jgi:hypothetical protein
MLVKERNLGSPAVASTTGVHAAVTDNGAQQVVTTAITNPVVPRNITVTAGGTAEDIKAIKVTVEGTNANNEKISEEIGPFTVNTAGTKEGSKAFKTVTKITIPAHDGEGATTAVGFGEKLGLGVRLARNSVLAAYFDGVREATAPTVAVSSTALESNTVDLNTALNTKVVIVGYYLTT